MFCYCLGLLLHCVCISIADNCVGMDCSIRAIVLLCRFYQLFLVTVVLLLSIILSVDPLLCCEHWMDTIQIALQLFQISLNFCSVLVNLMLFLWHLLSVVPWPNFDM